MDHLIKLGNKLKVRLANAIRISTPATRHRLIRQLNSMMKYTTKHPERCDYKVIRTAMSDHYSDRKFARYEIITGNLELEIWVEEAVVKMSYRIRETVRCDPAIDNGPMREQLIQLWEGTSIVENGTVVMAGIFTMIFIDVNCDESRELSNYFNGLWQSPSAKKAVDIHLKVVGDDTWESLTKRNIENAINARTFHIDLEGMDDEDYFGTLADKLSPITGDHPLSRDRVYRNSQNPNVIVTTLEYTHELCGNLHCDKCDQW